MIIYFSGTGNSRYIAKRIADGLGDEAISLNDKIKKKDTEPIEVNGRLIIVTPTYAWRIPRIVNDWIKSTKLSNVKGVWFVMSCGGEIGNAAKFNRELCDEKGFDYMGSAQVLMPENYIALFDTPSVDEARKIANEAEPIIDKIIKAISDGKEFPKPRNNTYDRFMSAPVNKVFYPLCVKAKAFHTNEKCVGCGKCAELCPLNNISLKNGKPIWGNDCTHCMACISYCPTGAIEYGKKSAKKPRYTFENL